MKAIQITQTGGPEVMSIREGRYANPVPFTPGQEAAGTIVALGANVSHLKEGDHKGGRGCRITFFPYFGTKQKGVEA